MRDAVRCSRVVSTPEENVRERTAVMDGPESGHQATATRPSDLGGIREYEDGEEAVPVTLRGQLRGAREGSGGRRDRRPEGTMGLRPGRGYIEGGG